MPTTQQLLDEAKTALHKLVTGTLRVSVGYGDNTVTFNKADQAKLERYIAKLEAQLAGRMPARNRVRYGVPD